MSDKILPLGQETDYPKQYSPDVLFPISRDESRVGFEHPPFDGVDIWNAWELTWLGPGNRPSVATAEIRVPAMSPNLIESKSLKLYLNSFAMTRFDDERAVADAMTQDLSATAGSNVEVVLQPVAETESSSPARLPGRCLDHLSIQCDRWEVDSSLLFADTNQVVQEALHTHLLRSLCPVTGQPDIGSLAVQYQGPKINEESLLNYIVSFREHSDFHEACIERMFMAILARCSPDKLTVYARYQRRGGIDINPFRSNFDLSPANLRLWRQ